MDEFTTSDLEVLYDGSESSGEGIDIVAVNGLNGDPRRSWMLGGSEENRSTWLEELLPQKLPNARVMLFGYNSHGTGEKSLLSAEGLTHAAESLLAVLDSNRADAPYHNRPLTFIAHDLGGVVVKKAIMMASRKKGLSSIANNAHRLLFFGTPQRASDSVSWDDLVFNIIFATHSSPTLVHNLRSRVRIFSKALAQVVMEFNSMITMQRVVNVYQQGCDSGIEGGSAVVNYYSATTNLIYETNIGRDSRHQDLCRLSETDPDSLVILEALKTESDQDYVKCLSTLLTLAPSFPVPAEVRGGLGEMEKLQEIEAWLGGESSAITYLHDHQGEDGRVFSGTLFRLLQRLKPGHDRVVYYSFSGDDGRQTTSTSLLSSLIYQILNQDPARFWQVHDLFLAIDKHSSWTSHALWIFFRSLIMTLGSETLYCVINGTHYCDSSWIQLLKNLSALKAKENISTIFKIILIGQERQDIENLFHAIPGVRLDSQELFIVLLQSQRAQEVAKLIEERHFLVEFAQKIKDTLDKCESLFQLSLSVNVLKDSSLELLTNSKSIRSQVYGLPYKVSDLISKTFQTLPEWARKALGWILHAQRPMKTNELAVAIALIGKRDSVVLDKDEILLDLPKDLKTVFNQLITFENNEARFSHEQVKYYFQLAVKDEQEPKEVGANQETHSPEKKQQNIPLVCDWDITCILLNCLRSEEVLSMTKEAVQEGASEKPQDPIFDLIEYAVQFWPAHYRKAKELGSHTKELLDLLQHRDLMQTWSKLSCKFGNTLSPPDVCVIDPFYLSALLGFADIVDLYLRKETGKSVTLQVHSFALCLASWAGHLDVLTSLIDNSPGNFSESLSLALKYASNQGYEAIVELLIEKLPKPTQKLAWDPALLCGAAELGYQALVSIFLKAGADVNGIHEGITPLQLAARNGHESIIDNLLFQKADPDSTLAKDSSKAIHLAASRGHTAVIEHLLKFHANVYITDNHGHTALHLASENGYQQIVKLLSEQHPHVMSQDNNGQTALHLASLNGHTEVIKLLTLDKRELEIDIQDTLGNTPLNLASKNGHLSIVELLLDKGASTDLTENGERTGHTALYYATSNGHEAIAEKILGATAKERSFVDITEVLLQAAKQGFNLVSELCIGRISRTDLDSRDNDNYSALHYAAEGGHVGIVSKLINHGATVDPETNPIGTPLALAASAGRIQVVRLLLAANADALVRVDDHNLAYQVACVSSNTDGHADAVQALLEAGVDPNDVDDEGNSALHYAARNDNVKVARVLLNYGANPALQNNFFCWTPLHLAARRNHKEVVQLFVDRGIDLLTSDDDGWTSMHLAAMYGAVSVMEVLWKAAPVLLNRRSDDRRTPLHFAYDEIRSTEWLLDHSIDVDAVSNVGKTALIMSADIGQDTIVGLLLSHNASVRLRDNSQKTALHYAARSGYGVVAQKILEKDINIINEQDDDGYSALHTAIFGKELEFVRMLLEKRPHIEINLKDGRGNTPLLLAVQAHLDEVVGYLLKHEAETESRNNKGETALLLAIKLHAESTWKILLQSSDHVHVNEGGGAMPTALHMAAKIGELEAVQQLLEHGADVNAQGGLYNTALQAAAASGFDNVVEYLLKKDADASLGGGLFANALSAAVSSGMVDMFRMLYERKADTNAQDDQGRTAVHLAAWRGSLDTIQWLMDHQGELSVKDRQGRTVVHHAAMSGSLDVVEMLMHDEKWESLNVQDIDGWTPLHWACRTDGNEEMIKLLNDDEAKLFNETKYGWTPENIAVFHDTRELLSLLNPAAKETAGDEVPDNWEEEHPPQPTQPLKKKTWKVGFCHEGFSCDGCHQFPIYGRRWRCTECEDFDFCFKCSWSREDTHPKHRFEEKGEGPETTPEYECDGD